MWYNCSGQCTDATLPCRDFWTSWPKRKNVFCMSDNQFVFLFYFNTEVTITFHFCSDFYERKRLIKSILLDFYIHFYSSLCHRKGMLSFSGTIFCYCRWECSFEESTHWEYFKHFHQYLFLLDMCIWKKFWCLSYVFNGGLSFHGLWYGSFQYVVYCILS